MAVDPRRRERLRASRRLAAGPSRHAAGPAAISWSIAAPHTPADSSSFFGGLSCKPCVARGALINRRTRRDRRILTHPVAALAAGEAAGAARHVFEIEPLPARSSALEFPRDHHHAALTGRSESPRIVERHSGRRLDNIGPLHSRRNVLSNIVDKRQLDFLNRRCTAGRCSDTAATPLTASHEERAPTMVHTTMNATPTTEWIRTKAHRDEFRCRWRKASRPARTDPRMSAGPAGRPG